MTNGKRKLQRRWHDTIRLAHRNSGPGTGTFKYHGPGRRHGHGNKATAYHSTATATESATPAALKAARQKQVEK